MLLKTVIQLFVHFFPVSAEDFLYILQGLAIIQEPAVQGSNLALEPSKALCLLQRAFHAALPAKDGSVLQIS